VTRLLAVTVGRTVVAAPRHAFALNVAGDTIYKVVAHEEVEPAVAVVIKKRRRYTPSAGISGTAFLRDVGKRAVPVVAEQHCPIQPRAIDVDEAVVIEVADRHAHAVRAYVDAGLISDVGEVNCPRAVGVDDQVVSKEVIFEN